MIKGYDFLTRGNHQCMVAVFITALHQYLYQFLWLSQKVIKNQKNLFSHSSGGEKPQIKLSAGPRASDGESVSCFSSCQQSLVFLDLWTHNSNLASVFIFPPLLHLCASSSPFLLLTRTYTIGFRAHPQSVWVTSLEIFTLIIHAKALFQIRLCSDVPSGPICWGNIVQFTTKRVISQIVSP